MAGQRWRWTVRAMRFRADVRRAMPDVALARRYGLKRRATQSRAERPSARSKHSTRAVTTLNPCRRPTASLPMGSAFITAGARIRRRPCGPRSSLRFGGLNGVGSGGALQRLLRRPPAGGPNKDRQPETRGPCRPQTDNMPPMRQSSQCSIVAIGIGAAQRSVIDHIDSQDRHAVIS